ncbi:ABC-2 type transport system ATP-binding protein [Haloactinopolyspora alba]|uniref:ABC-2 type transport system ATP-binding protein n=1 Tax=Haloactinopolyspora alba TaxID=648780 RepID=A0A2P8E2B2_9ACTN|nr:ABC transporter ATP-binding protein [Haloactinopolyspora alba]PSL03604.1 ABC-2 type transport system ATP-binding protein [Haloactinopolyspora alba]
MDDVIEVSELRRSYGGEFDAVRGVTFSVRRGELFALLGTNGAGKTSTLEVIEGLAPPSGGGARVLGHDPYRERASVRPRIGVMLQQGGFPGDLTVRETAAMWAGTLSAPRPVADALEMVVLDARADVAVKQLSGGERRRLDLAMALLGRPEVLFLDEPTTGLDPESRRNTWTLVRRLLDDGTTVLLTTHYLDEAEELADRLAIMHHGRIVRTGTVAEVVAAQPSTITFERDAPGAPPLPELPGALVVDDGRAVTVHTDTLQETLTDVMLWARHHEVVLDQLSARTASLEQAFLAVASENTSELAEEAAA